MLLGVVIKNKKLISKKFICSPQMKKILESQKNYIKEEEIKCCRNFPCIEKNVRLKE